MRRWRSRPWRLPRLFASITCLAFLLLLTPPAWGTHLPNHRYTILGFVLDEKGGPVSGGRVRILNKRDQVVGFAPTNAQGFYAVLIHAHDEDLGKELRVAVGKAVVRIKLSFEVRDTRSERGTRVDFQGPTGREKPALFSETMARARIKYP